MRQIYISTEGTHPISVEEIKAYVDYHGVDYNTESVLENLSLAARLRLEEFCGRNFVDKTMVMIVDKVDHRQCLPYGPINTVTSVQIYDEDNVLDDTLTAGTDYNLMSEFDKYIKFDSITSGEYVKITYTAGYGTTAYPLPEALKRAILAQTKYDFRNASGGGDSSQTMLSNEAKALVAPYRVYEV